MLFSLNQGIFLWGNMIFLSVIEGNDMKKKSIMQFFTWAVLLLLIPLYADDVKQDISKYFENINPDIIALLPSPPLDGSPEHMAELAFLKRISNERSKSEIAMAESQVHLDFFTFSSVIGNWFQKESLPKTYAFFKRVEKTTKAVTNIGKAYWKRTRPYDFDPSVIPLKKEKVLAIPAVTLHGEWFTALFWRKFFPIKKKNCFNLASILVGTASLQMFIIQAMSILAGYWGWL